MEDYEKAKESNPNIKLVARTLLEYRETRDGYWTYEKFLKQIKECGTCASCTRIIAKLLVSISTNTFSINQYKTLESLNKIQ